MNTHCQKPFRVFFIGLYLLLVVLPFQQACTPARASTLNLDFAGEMLPLQESGVSSSFSTDKFAVLTEAVTIENQEHLLQELVEADGHRQEPAIPGTWFTLETARQVPSGHNLVLKVKTVAPALRCEVFSSDKSQVGIRNWFYPPVWAFPENTWEIEIALPPHFSMSGFRISSLMADSTVQVSQAELRPTAKLICLEPGQIHLPTDTRILVEGPKIRVSWPDGYFQDSQHVQNSLAVNYRAGSPNPLNRVFLTVGGKENKQTSFELRVRSGQHELPLYADSLGFPIQSLTIDKGHSDLQILTIHGMDPRKTMTGTATARPLLADLWTVLNFPQAAWRQTDFEVFSWNLFPDILIIDFASLDIQDRFLKRLIFFTEKKGFRGTLQSDAVIKTKHGWNANDFRSESLAAFFSLARQQKFVLNPAEVRLLEMALNWGLLRPDADGFVAVKGGFVSLARGGLSEGTRSLLLQHECIHGIFFSSKEFRDVCQINYNRLSAESRQFMIDYFSFYQYDPSDEYLMVNELAAYLLQQSLPQLKSFILGNMVNNYAKIVPAERGRFTARAQAAADELVDNAHLLADDLWRLTAISPAELACLVHTPNGAN